MAMKRLNFEALPSEDSLAIPVLGGDPPRYVKYSPAEKRARLVDLQQRFDDEMMKPGASMVDPFAVFLRNQMKSVSQDKQYGTPEVHYKLGADLPQDDLSVALPAAAERQPEPWDDVQWKRVQPNPNSWKTSRHRQGYRKRDVTEAGVLYDEEGRVWNTMHNEYIEDLNQRLTDASREYSAALAAGDADVAQAAGDRARTLGWQKRAARRNAQQYGKGSQRDSKMALPAHPGTPRKPKKPDPNVRIVTL